MKYSILGVLALATLAAGTAAADVPLGLPAVPIPADNPQTPEKIRLGEKLFNDKRFSSAGTVSCSTCHVSDKAFTDSPLKVSEGIEGRTGTRNAPTVINAAYMTSQFWDGREASLERQSTQPFLNPVEMALPSHRPILDVVQNDPEYIAMFREVFGASGDDITMDEVTKAIAAFERTIIAGDSPFDRWYFAGEKDAMTEEQVRGFDLFLNKARCVSCHTIEQDHALFTDSEFHNIGIGITQIEDEVRPLAQSFIRAKMEGADVDVAVLTDKRTSELGRLAVTNDITVVGAFKTPTLRNVEVTAPYMHDGSLKTLRDVVEHYNNGGVSNKEDKATAFLSGGIRPLDLSESEMHDLVAFMLALTSPEFAKK